MADREVNAPECERDVALMRRALELAARGPLRDPNPRVGAVIVDPGGLVVGEGFHAGAGTPHAEVMALRQAGAAARGVRFFRVLWGILALSGVAESPS